MRKWLVRIGGWLLVEKWWQECVVESLVERRVNKRLLWEEMGGRKLGR